VRKRLEVLRFISGFIRDNKYCPNLRDLGSALNICQSSAYARVKRLRKNGLVDYLDNSPRTLHLTEAGYALWNASALHSEARGEALDPAPVSEYPQEATEALERKNGFTGPWVDNTLTGFWIGRPDEKPEEPKEPLPEHSP
jgi:DNA-binding MarR family transcriptional regulator